MKQSIMNILKLITDRTISRDNIIVGSLHDCTSLAPDGLLAGPTDGL